MTDWFHCRSRIEKAINGAIQSAIDVHGPITKHNKASTTKRVYSQLKALRKEITTEETKKVARRE